LTTCIIYLYKHKSNRLILISYSINILKMSLSGLPAQLMTKDGLKATEAVLANKKAVGLYFSAHWCPPCRGFTPVLAQFYTELKAADPDALEIIFVSSDQDDNAFQEYYGDMPWTSVPFGDDAQDSLGQAFGVRGIPSFQVLNAASGALVDSDGRSSVMGGKGDVVGTAKKWAA
jgi:nucleoredoxin